MHDISDGWCFPVVKDQKVVSFNDEGSVHENHLHLSHWR